jgi:NTE family protein
MAAEPFLRPDVLVLGAGGTVGEAWMTGVLAGIEEAAAIDLRACEHFIGTSAGSIVAASLVAGRPPRRPADPESAAEEAWESAVDEGGRSPLATVAERAIGLAAPLAAPAMRVTAPGGALLRSILLARAPGTSGRLDSLAAHVDREGARFDGRLRIVCVDRDNGRRVVFGSPGAPPATVGQAVHASCAIPWVFRPVTIGGREYVDGGMWSLTNMDVAPAGRGTHVLCLSVAGATSATGPLAAMGRLARSAATVEALALRNRAAVVRIVAPDGQASSAIGPDLMDRSRVDAALAAGYRQGLSIATASP